MLIDHGSATHLQMENCTVALASYYLKQKVFLHVDLMIGNMDKKKIQLMKTAINIETVWLQYVLGKQLVVV